ncbi:MAG: hypothetical protein ACM3VT_13695 [Solirubrobacterales bacterium]
MRRLLLGLLFVFAVALAGCEGEEHGDRKEWRGQQYPYGYAPQGGYYPPYGYVPPDGYDGRRDGYERREGGERREEEREGERRERIELNDESQQLEIIVAE